MADCDQNKKIKMADSSKLPQPLIDKVLVRLPAESVRRFRRVSKLWRSHLSSPNFMKSHRDFQIGSGARTIIVPVFDLTKYPFFEDPIPHLVTFAADGDGSSNKVTSPLFSKRVGWFQGIRVLNSCHGFALILLNAGMFVFNPVTLEFLQIPRVEGFDKCASEYGLGYDGLSDDYKVVRLSCSDTITGRDYDGTYVHVYSLKIKSWRKRIANCPYHLNFSGLNSGAYANGRLHWFALDDDREYVIAAFDLDREEFEEVPMLATGNFYDRNCCSLAVFGERFAVVDHSPLTSGRCDDIWVMEQYGVGNSWTKLVIDTQGYKGEHPARFVCLSREDEILFRTCCEEFVLYNRSTGVWREFVVEGIRKGYNDGAIAMTECLLSPDISD